MEPGKRMDSCNHQRTGTYYSEARLALVTQCRKCKKIVKETDKLELIEIKHRHKIQQRAQKKYFNAPVRDLSYAETIHFN